MKWMTDICNEVVRSGVVPVDWKRSWMVNVYKEKGNALECSSYRGIKLLDHNYIKGVGKSSRGAAWKGCKDR